MLLNNFCKSRGRRDFKMNEIINSISKIFFKQGLLATIEIVQCAKQFAWSILEFVRKNAEM